MWTHLIVLAALLLAPAAALAQESKTYKDTRGKAVVFPLGDLSFADEIVDYDPAGSKVPAAESHPTAALGPPDYKRSGDEKGLTLGCGGTLVAKFTDNALVEIEGPDLYVFEVGPAIEAMHAAISGDGETWIDIGTIKGATAAVDIAAFAEPGDTFSYVRLTDAKRSCSGRWPGADIDAVGAIGAGRRIVLDSAVLFDFDKSDLKPAASTVLTKLADDLKAVKLSRVVIEGHTDNVGADDYNQRLSNARAAAVGAFLVGQGAVTADILNTVGYGESRPAAPNDTDENRAKNRRVELVIVVR